MIQKNSGQITHLYSLRGMEVEDQAANVEAELKLLMNEVTTCDNLYLLLTKFKDLFLEPTSLPPQRPFDHSIHIKPNAEPVNVRSYRHALVQKTEIENQVKDMLAHSLIQPNHSSYASTVLLVKKKNGTWPFCVGYR